MAKLTPEQRAELQRQLDDDAAADDDFEVEIRDGDRSTRIPYGKAKDWLAKNFGIDLAEDTGDEPEDDGKPVKAVKDDQPRRFAGRRLGA